MMILAVNTDARGTGSAGGHSTLPIVSCIGSTETKDIVRLEPAAAQGTFSSSTSMAEIWFSIFGGSAVNRRTFHDGCFVSGKYTKPFTDLDDTTEQPTGHGHTRSLPLEYVRYGYSHRTGDVASGRFQFVWSKYEVRMRKGITWQPTEKVDQRRTIIPL